MNQFKYLMTKNHTQPSLNQLTQTKKSPRVLRLKKKLSCLMIVALSCTLVVNSVHAQWVVTDPISDVLSAIQAANALAQDALMYENQILQYQSMLKNLERNPQAGILPNFGLLVSNAIKIRQNNIQIASSMGDVSTTISKTFKTPQPNFGAQFGIWTQASQNGFQATMLNAGIQRDALNNTDQAQLQALVAKNMASGGQLAALQTLGEFMAMQLQESQKLRDLITSEQISSNTAMMQASSNNQYLQTQQQQLAKPYNPTIPNMDSTKVVYVNNNFYPTH